MLIVGGFLTKETSAQLAWRIGGHLCDARRVDTKRLGIQCPKYQAPFTIPRKFV